MTGARSAPAPLRAAAVVGLLLAAAFSPAPAQDPPFDPGGLAAGPYAEACMLLERTLFQVDVLTVELRLGPDVADRVRALVEAGASRDSIAETVLRSRDAWIRVEFVRDVAMDRFLDGVRQDLSRTVEAGIIPPRTYREISARLPRWYRFLDGRGIREGDELLYRVRGDTLHSGFRAASGERLMQQTQVGREHRLAVLGSYLVAGSSFRQGLIRSLLDGDPC